MKFNDIYITIIALVFLQKYIECLASLGNGSIKGQKSLTEKLRLFCQMKPYLCTEGDDNLIETTLLRAQTRDYGLKNTASITSGKANKKKTAYTELHSLLGDLERNLNDANQKKKRDKTNITSLKNSIKANILLRYLYDLISSEQLKNRSTFKEEQRDK